MTRGTRQKIDFVAVATARITTLCMNADPYEISSGKSPGKRQGRVGARGRALYKQALTNK